MESKKKYSEDVAAKLFWNLHSSENENILSTLLTGSLNESNEFMELFCTRAGLHHSLDFKRFYAESNRTIPEPLRGKKSTVRRYLHPDVLVLDSRCEDEWNRLASEYPKKDWSSALGAIHAVFVEVKHKALSKWDRQKYVAFNNKISEHFSEDKVRFVILSSHTSRGLDNSDNSEWFELRKAIGDHQHVLLREVQESIRGIDRRKCRRCTFLGLFDDYLALWLGPYRSGGESVHTRYWADIIADLSRSKSTESSYLSLKKEILDYVGWIAKANGFSKAYWNRFKEDDAIGPLESVRLTRKTCGTSFAGKKGNVRSLVVDVDDATFGFAPRLSQQKRAAQEIVETMAKIAQLLSE